MTRRPPRFTRTDTLFPYPTLFRSFWFPKITGRLLVERLGKWHFWTTFIGFHMTFLVQHWLGSEGMPRRYADYLPSDGFTTLNSISSIGAFILGASTLPFVWNVFRSEERRVGKECGSTCRSRWAPST